MATDVKLNSNRSSNSSQRDSINKIKNIGAIKKCPPEIIQVESRKDEEAKPTIKSARSKKSHKTLKSVKYIQDEKENEAVSLKDLNEDC